MKKLLARLLYWHHTMWHNHIGEWELVNGKTTYISCHTCKKVFYGKPRVSILELQNKHAA